jgi:hypothetical protein
MGHCYCIEYQKRGLLHSHLLSFLHEKDHFLDPAIIDKIICAEFLSWEADPELYNIITLTMVHGPCGDENPNCLYMTQKVRDSMKCSKDLSKAFCNETTMLANSFPLYRRCRGVGNSSRIRLPTNWNAEITLDNNCVLPYNPYFS